MSSNYRFYFITGDFEQARAKSTSVRPTALAIQNIPATSTPNLIVTQPPVQPVRPELPPGQLFTPPIAPPPRPAVTEVRSTSVICADRAEAMNLGAKAAPERAPDRTSGRHYRHRYRRRVSRRSARERRDNRETNAHGQQRGFDSQSSHSPSRSPASHSDDATPPGLWDAGLWTGRPYEHVASSSAAAPPLPPHH